MYPLDFFYSMRYALCAMRFSLCAMRHALSVLLILGQWLSWESDAFATHRSWVRIPSAPPVLLRGYSVDAVAPFICLTRFPFSLESSSPRKTSPANWLETNISGNGLHRGQADLNKFLERHTQLRARGDLFQVCSLRKTGLGKTLQH